MSSKRTFLSKSLWVASRLLSGWMQEESEKPQALTPQADEDEDVTSHVGTYLPCSKCLRSLLITREAEVLFYPPSSRVPSPAGH